AHHLRAFAVRRGHLEEFAMSLIYESRLRLGEPSCVADDDVEHATQIERGARDHLEHLCGGGLALERLLRLVEQAHVLDRDRRLVRERLRELDLSLGERPRLAPPHDDHAEHAPRPEYW